MKPMELADLIRETIIYEVENREWVTSYRDPIIGFWPPMIPGSRN